MTYRSAKEEYKWALDHMEYAECVRLFSLAQMYMTCMDEPTLALVYAAADEVRALMNR